MPNGANSVHKELCTELENYKVAVLCEDTNITVGSK